MKINVTAIENTVSASGWWAQQTPVRGEMTTKLVPIAVLATMAWGSAGEDEELDHSGSSFFALTLSEYREIIEYVISDRVVFDGGMFEREIYYESEFVEIGASLKPPAKPH